MLSSKSHQVRKLAVILHADVVGSTELVQKNEVISHERIQNAFHRLSNIIGNYGGIAHEIRGDALVAEFGRASDSVCAALAFQNANLTFNKELTDEIQPEIRIGISLGEVVIADGTITGAGVVLAQRLEHLAKPNGVVVQATVSETVPIRLPFAFESLGEQKLKGFDQPVRAYTAQTKQGELVPEPESDDFTQGVATQHNKDSNRQILSDIGKPSLAVLPFDNMSEDPNQSYFSDGITEDIITDLSKISSIFVVARSSSFTYKGRSEKTQKVCADLGVRYVVEGSVRKSGNKVRITAQLIDGSSDRHVWADRYDGTLEDIFTLQDEVTCQIVDALKIQLLPEEIRAIRNVPTSNMEAYEYYLKGRQSFHIFTEEKLYDARDLYSRAIDCDPAYALAYCGLADVYSFLRWNHGKNYLTLVHAIVAAAKAIEISNELANGHASMGMALTVACEYDGAVEEFTKAVALDPNLYEAHYYWGRACFSEGRLEETAMHFEAAWKLSPSDPQTPSMLLQVYRSLGKKTDQERAARETVKTGLKKLEAEPENWRVCLSTAFGFMSLGNFEEMSRYMNQAVAHNPKDATVNYNVACLNCGIGEFENAIESLRISFANGVSKDTIAWMKNDSDLDPIRDHPKFQKLMDEQG